MKKDRKKQKKAERKKEVVSLSDPAKEMKTGRLRVSEDGRKNKDGWRETDEKRRKGGEGKTGRRRGTGRGTGTVRRRENNRRNDKRWMPGSNEAGLMEKKTEVEIT